ncbi:MAG: hypothetical protein V7765_21715 [Oleispira sp.]
MFTTDKEQSILNEHKRKDMISLYRSLLSKISKLKLINLQVDLSVSFTNDLRLGITVYDIVNSNNGTFNAYQFQEISAMKDDSEFVMSAIRTDNFLEFNKVLKELDERRYGVKGNDCE